MTDRDETMIATATPIGIIAILDDVTPPPPPPVPPLVIDIAGAQQMMIDITAGTINTTIVIIVATIPAVDLAPAHLVATDEVAVDRSLHCACLY
jgi:hypothetical protein